MFSDDSKLKNSGNIQLELDWLNNLSDFRDNYDTEQNFGSRNTLNGLDNEAFENSVDIRKKLQNENRKYYKLFSFVSKISSKK